MTMEICDLGIMEYEEAAVVQDRLLFERIENKIPDTLILVEHEPVLSLGRKSEEDSIINKNYFMENNIPVVSYGRGGEITYHSPGQLVVYPVIDLKNKKKDISFYINFLEKTIVSALNSLGVPAEREYGKRGVWSSGKKIGFIGIAVKKWVTFHGAAININNDITPFFHINPCGEPDITVTSAEICSGRDLNMKDVKNAFIQGFIRGLREEYQTEGAAI